MWYLLLPTLYRYYSYYKSLLHVVCCTWIPLTLLTLPVVPVLDRQIVQKNDAVNKLNKWIKFLNLILSQMILRSEFCRSCSVWKTKNIAVVTYVKLHHKQNLIQNINRLFNFITQIRDLASIDGRHQARIWSLSCRFTFTFTASYTVRCWTQETIQG